MILLMAAAAGALLAWVFWIEPNWIEVTRHRVRAPVDSPLTIAHLTDLHSFGLGRRERKLLALLRRERPDLIVVTGDTVDKRSSHEKVREVYRQLSAPLGVWAVRGNWEILRPAKDEEGFYRSAGVRYLKNSSCPLKSNVWMVGLDDATEGSPDWEKALEGVPKGAFAVTLFHSPEFFDRLDGRGPLALCGHAHGGQVVFPGLGVLWLPRGCGRYSAGWYSKNGSRMYVNRGVGTSILPLRFLCRPELAILTLEPLPQRGGV